MSGRTMEMNAADVSRCQSSPGAVQVDSAMVSSCSPWSPRGRCRRPAGRSTPTGTGRSRTQRAPAPTGHDQPPEDREVVGAVDLGRLDDRRRQRADVVAQQVDRERQAERGVGQPDPEERAVEVQVGEDRQPADLRAAGVEPQDRDQRHLERHHQQGHHQHEHHVAAPELHPREGVGGEGGDRDGDDRRRDGHRQAVEEGVLEAAGVERLAVVLERPLARLEDGW